jgi:NitT/TauT family transport system substrate-binding protein
LLGGSADVVCGFYDHTIQMAAEGQALVAFIVLVRHPGLVLVVSPATSRRIGSAGDLDGAKIGVTAPGSSTHFFLNYILSRHGVNPERVSVIGIGHAASAMAAMESGNVDAAVMTDPAVSQLARRAGSVRILADTRTTEGVLAEFGAREMPASVFYARNEWIAANEDTVRRLTRAMRRTLGFIQQSNSKGIAAKMPASHRGEDRGLYEAALTASLPIFAGGGPMPEGGPETVARMLGLSLPKVREARVDLSKTFTDRFVK